MNEYTISDITVGTKASFTEEITEQKLSLFLSLTGDNNPLHCDSEHAKQKGYKDRVVYGMLAASLYSTLAGVYLPGKHCLLQEVSTKFRKPVFVGDTLTVSGIVSHVSEAVGRITIKAETRNQNGEKVNSATIEAGVSN